MVPSLRNTLHAIYETSLRCSPRLPQLTRRAPTHELLALRILWRNATNPRASCLYQDTPKRHQRNPLAAPKKAACTRQVDSWKRFAPTKYHVPGIRRSPKEIWVEMIRVQVLHSFNITGSWKSVAILNSNVEETFRVIASGQDVFFVVLQESSASLIGGAIDRLEALLAKIHYFHNKKWNSLNSMNGEAVRQKK